MILTVSMGMVTGCRRRQDIHTFLSEVKGKGLAQLSTADTCLEFKGPQVGSQPLDGTWGRMVLSMMGTSLGLLKFKFDKTSKHQNFSTAQLKIFDQCWLLKGTFCSSKCVLSLKALCSDEYLHQGTDSTLVQIDPTHL